MKNSTPEATKIGFRPFNSENGARAIGAIAKPVQKVVIPTKSATSETCQSSDICLTAGEYEPAVKAVSIVAIQERETVNILWLPDHSNGDVYIFRFGRAGAGSEERFIDTLLVGEGISVSNVR